MRSTRIFTLIALIFFAAFVLAGCQEDVTPTPTPDFVLPSATFTAVPPTPRPTSTVALTSTPQPQTTPDPTSPPLATATLPPTQTPIPQAIIHVVGSEDGQPVPGAIVQLSQPDRGYLASFSTLEDGIAYFVGFVYSSEPYTLEINATGFRPVSFEMSLTQGVNQLTVQLESGVIARIITELANLRVSPGLNFDVVTEVQLGQVFPVINVSNDGLWVQVRTPEGLEGWIFTNLVEIEGDLEQLKVGTGGQGLVLFGTPAPTITAEGEINGTPNPTAAPSRPPRIKFDAQELYDGMITLQNVIVQMRGVLDRRTGDRQIECEEFVVYYGQVIAIQTYKNVPDDWVRIHNLYVNGANNALDTNRAVYLQCLDGGGQIIIFNFRNARNGVDFSLDRLQIGILGAEDLLGINQPAPDA